MDSFQLMQDEFGVLYRHSKSRDAEFIIGTFQQIVNCHRYLVEQLQSLCQVKEPPRYTTSRDQGTTATDTSREEINQPIVFQTIPMLLKFIFEVPKYSQHVKNIEQRCNVKISDENNGNDIKIEALPGCTHELFEDGCDSFITLYRKIHGKQMTLKEVVLEPGSDSNYLSVDEAIDEILRSTPVLIVRASTKDTWQFYGEETDVTSAIHDIRKMLCIENPLKKTSSRRRAPNSAQNAQTHLDDQQPLQHEATQREFYDQRQHHQNARSQLAYEGQLYETTQSGQPQDELQQRDLNRLPELTESASPQDANFSANMQNNDDKWKEVFLIKKGFQLTVQLSDITEEQVDVIVCCNDEHLTWSYTSGLAKAIIDKGGPMIYHEALAETKKKKIKAGDIVVTSAERLSCKKIMHVILWNGKRKKCVEKNIVNDSVLHCLQRIQGKMKMKSVAFPAVGANQKTGMELTHCANAMVNAVEKYMKENDPKKNAVTDIRFILFDTTAFGVFKIEIEKRYGDCRVKPTVERKDSQLRGYGMKHDMASSAREDSVGKKKSGKLV